LLLPHEIDLCESLGITPEEYWEFIFAAQEHVKERGKEYAHIPDVRNDPVTIAVNIVIGIALSAIAQMLAPKPKAPNQRDPRRLDIAGLEGRTRFTRSNNFDSVQQLADLGATIPLIFADYTVRNEGQANATQYGGVRVDTELLHSQMLSGGNNQLLYAVMSLGMSRIGKKPDYDGFAIGDLLLRDFNPERNALYFANRLDINGNRIQDTDQYSRSKLTVPDNTDAFSVWWPNASEWRKYFSGTRTPSTKIQFGCYAPISNGHRYLLPMELVMVPEGRSQIRKDNKKKREKLGAAYPRLCGIFSQDKTKIIYKVLGFKTEANPDEYKPWGLTDVIAAQEEIRITADEALQPNQELMLGDGVVGRVTKRLNAGIWDPYNEETFSYEIKLDKNTAIDIGQTLIDNDASEGGGEPWVRSAVQQVAIANLTNSRPCHATEIGIKSEVWRQMTGSVNFNGWPKQAVIEDYEKEKDTITIGAVNKYMKRYSFFALFVRDIRSQQATSDQAWVDITGDVPFAIRGTSPVNQYNTIHVEHPTVNGGTSVQEYQLIPVPGFRFYQQWLSGLSVDVHLLDGTELFKATNNNYSLNGYSVSFSGQNSAISASDASNPEWILGSDETLERSPVGPIAELSRKKTIGAPQLPPDVPAPDLPIGKDYKPASTDKACVQYGSKNGTRFFWNGSEVRGTIQNGDPSELNNSCWLRAQREAGVFKYEKGSIRQFYQPEIYQEVNNSPAGVITPGNSDGYNYVTCVYYDYIAQQYIYRWENTTVASIANKTKDWQYVETGDITSRYRIALGPRGENMKDPIQEEGFDYYDDPERTELYDSDGTNGKPLTGAVLLDDGRYQFWLNGSELGTNGGGGRNLYINGNSAGDSDRWRAMNVEQPYQPYEEERVNRIRECDPDKFDNFTRCVTSGVVMLTKVGDMTQSHMVEISNPNNPTETRMVRAVTIFVQGERLVKNGAFEDWDGNINKWEFEGLFYEPYKVGIEETPPMCGPADQRSPVYRLNVLQISEEKREFRSITYEFLREEFKAWQIEKEVLTQEIPAKWEIVKSETERSEPETPIESIENIRGEKLEEGEEGKRNISGKAKVQYYPSVDAYKWRINDPGNGYKTGEKVLIGEIGERGITVQSIVGTETDTGEDPSYANLTADGNNYFPLNAVCDYFLNGTDTSSHANGPEHSICFCNEIIKQAENEVPLYSDLALLGIKLTNSKEWSSFSNLSAWVDKGINVEHLVTDGTRGEQGQTNLFPEIAYALLTDNRIGAGKLIGKAAVDRSLMTQAAEFCQANDFYWDGVVSEAINLREFIFINAGYILCDFTIKGGRFALVPSVPFNSNYKIDAQQKINVKALFTDGNMKEGSMKVTFLSPEERQLFKAVVLYRQETRNGFPQTRTMTTYLNVGSDNDPIEEFDLTQFCTSENQARLFSRTALKLRQLVDHGITFDTTPQSAMGLEPGDYFKVATRVSHTDRFQSGMIDPAGNVVSSEDAATASFEVVYWRPGETQTQETTLTYSEGKTSNSALFGCIWAKVSTSQNTRVYKVETISYSDDGLVSVSGSFTPLTDSGSLAVIDYEDSDFVEVNT
tara:strand:- start:15 stop:4742 length:4728 start_codon:yes stop_codon:yes gene_type:complete